MLWFTSQAVFVVNCYSHIWFLPPEQEGALMPRGEQRPVKRSAADSGSEAGLGVPKRFSGRLSLRMPGSTFTSDIFFGLKWDILLTWIKFISLGFFPATSFVFPHFRCILEPYSQRSINASKTLSSTSYRQESTQFSELQSRLCVLSHTAESRYRPWAPSQHHTNTPGNVHSAAPGQSGFPSFCPTLSGTCVFSI